MSNVENAKKKTDFCWNIEVWAVQKHVNLVDLAKSFPTSRYLLAEFSFDAAENEPLEIWTFGREFGNLDGWKFLY